MKNIRSTGPCATLSAFLILFSLGASFANAAQGERWAHWGRCTDEEIGRGYRTQMRWHNGVGGGDFITACLAPRLADREAFAEIEELDVLMTIDGQTEAVTCCGGHHTPRECPCPY